MVPARFQSATYFKFSANGDHSFTDMQSVLYLHRDNFIGADCSDIGLVFALLLSVLFFRSLSWIQHVFTWRQLTLWRYSPISSRVTNVPLSFCTILYHRIVRILRKYIASQRLPSKLYCLLVLFWRARWMSGTWFVITWCYSMNVVIEMSPIPSLPNSKEFKPTALLVSL